MTRKTADVVADQVGRIDQYNDLRREAGLSSYLMAYADSSTTTLKVLINEGNAYFGGTMVEFAGGYSPEIVDTTASSRIDVLSFKSNNSITRTAGVEADSPTAPAIPAGEIPICSIYMRKSATSIEDEDDSTNGYIYKDLRSALSRYDVLAPGTEIIGGALTENPRSNNTTYEKVKEVAIGRAGIVTVSFALKKSATTIYGRVYINGAAVGTERAETTSSYVVYTEDFTVAIGDLIQLYVKAGAAVATYGYYKDFKILVASGGSAVTVLDG